MREWIDAAATASGLGRVESVSVFRDMPWATVCTVATASDDVWFKANHASFAYEGDLLRLIDRVWPGRVQCPLVVNDDGWFLSADGGLVSTPESTDASDIVSAYVDVQLATSEIVDDLLSLGVPDRRPAYLPDRFEEITASPVVGDFEPALRAVSTRFAEHCDVLAADGRACVTNSDVKWEHAFVGPPLRLFDFGDSVVTHPFVSLDRVGLMSDDDPTSAHLRSQVLDAWGGSESELAAAASVVGALLHADVWLRDPPGARELFPDAIPRVITRFLDRITTS